MDVSLKFRYLHDSLFLSRFRNGYNHADRVSDRPIEAAAEPRPADAWRIAPTEVLCG